VEKDGGGKIDLSKNKKPKWYRDVIGKKKTSTKLLQRMVKGNSCYLQKKTKEKKRKRSSHAGWPFTSVSYRGGGGGETKFNKGDNSFLTW